MKKILLCFIMSIGTSIGLYAQNNFLHFDGVDDYVNLGNTVGNSNFRTIEMWFKPDENITTTSNHYYNALIARDNSNQDCEFSISFSTEANPGKLAFGLAVTHLNYHFIYSDQDSWNADTWYHVAVVIDTTGMRMYINGVLQSSTNPYNVTPCATGDNTALGRWGDMNIRHFKGAIDEVRIWDHARTQMQIQNNLNSQLSGSETGLIAYYNFNQGIAGGNNPTVLQLQDALNNYNGLLYNFSLNGPSSNWLGATGIGVTNVQNSQCGITLPFYNSIVYANAVPNAQMYRFKVTNLGTNQVVTQDYILRNLFMHNLSNFEYSQVYKVEVAVKRNNVWEAYGSPCSITTASAFTKVIASQCGTSLTSRNTIISADNVNLAQGYRFKVTNLTTNSVQYIDRTTRTFNFNAVTDYALGTTYQIEVAVKNTNGQYLPYGIACTVTTPFTKVQHENSTESEIQATSIQTQAYPNPFVNGFTVSVATPSKSEVSLAIYDMLGKEMESRIVPIDELESLELGNQLGSGVYTVVLVQDDNRVAFKMVKR